MPRPPRFRSPRMRSVALSVLMFALLVASTAIAWALTGAPILPTDPPTGNTVTLGGVRLELSPDWNLQTATAEHAPPFEIWRFDNAARPGIEQLVIRSTQIAEGQTAQPAEVLQSILPRLFSGVKIDPMAKPTAGADSDAQWIDLLVTTRRITSVATEPRIHAVRVVTPDQQRFWIIQLTEALTAQQWNQYAPAIAQGQIEQLHRLAQSMRFAQDDDATPGEPTPDAEP